MKHLLAGALVALVVVGVPAAALAASASAGADPGLPTAEFFGWATGAGGVEWAQGLALGLLGLVGALVTVYLFLDEPLPSIGGKARLDADQGLLDQLDAKQRHSMEQRERLSRGDAPVDAERVRAEESIYEGYAEKITDLQKSINARRHRMMLIGIPSYLVLGGILASAIATNLLQAVVIGFSWTAVAERIGLTRDQKDREEIKQTSLDTLTRAQTPDPAIARNVATLEEANRLLTERLGRAVESRMDSDHDGEGATR